MFLVLRFYRRLLALTTYALPWLAFQAGYTVWALASTGVGRTVAYPRHGHIGTILIATLIWIFMAERYRVTVVDELFRERTGFKIVISSASATAVVLLGVLFFSRDTVFPRGLFVTAMSSLVLFAVIMRGLFRTAIRQAKKWMKPTQILVIGADEFAHRATERLNRLSHAPCSVAGYVRLQGQTVIPGSVPVYRLEEIGDLNAKHGFTEVVIAIPPAHFSTLPAVVEALKRLSLPARAIVDLGEGIVVRERLFQMGRMQMLDLTATPTDSLDYALLKRCFDIVFSALVLLLSLPLSVAIAVIIRLTSPGPVLFAQERIGMNGKPFMMYKFRTMVVSSKDQSDTVWTTQNDPRRTPVGRFLRRTSLDELPQFINVLKGNMSVVGPRPERPHFAQQFLQDVSCYNNRHWMKVGITGWAQVNGWRGDTSISKRIEHDLYYLQNWSLAFDLRIIALTISSVLIQRNAC